MTYEEKLTALFKDKCPGYYKPGDIVEDLEMTSYEGGYCETCSYSTSAWQFKVKTASGGRRYDIVEYYVVGTKSLMELMLMLDKYGEPF
jgi:hypothetical protein